MRAMLGPAVQEPRFRVVVTTDRWAWGLDVEAVSARIATELAAAAFIQDRLCPVPAGERLQFWRTCQRDDVEVHDRQEVVRRGRRRDLKPFD